MVGSTTRTNAAAGKKVSRRSAGDISSGPSTSPATRIASARATVMPHRGLTGPLRREMKIQSPAERLPSARTGSQPPAVPRAEPARWSSSQQRDVAYRLSCSHPLQTLRTFYTPLPTS